jgi:hypothetical protein
MFHSSGMKLKQVGSVMSHTLRLTSVVDHQSDPDLVNSGNYINVVKDPSMTAVEAKIQLSQ